MNTKLLVIISAVSIILLGSGLGLLVSRKKSLKIEGASTEQLVKTDKQAGIKNCKGDQATGTLEKTSGKEQGTHKLIREGGPSQTIYMVSSVIDLEEYVGKKMDICGDTQKLQGVSWFMDVTQVKIVE